jgi:preprotein translocase subunit SecG
MTNHIIWESIGAGSGSGSAGGSTGCADAKKLMKVIKTVKYAFSRLFFILYLDYEVLVFNQQKYKKKLKKKVLFEKVKRKINLFEI